MTTSRGITDTRVYDREGVVERYGIPPELVTDFIGLKGDTSDNIPGVPGIGDKTAAQLLQQYGSLDEVLEHIDDISGEKRRQNLRENADLARISKSLATLHRGIDAGVDVAEIADRDARPLAAARGRSPLRAARPAAPAGGGARRAEAAPRAAGERRIEARAREDAGRRPRGAERRGGARGRRGRRAPCAGRPTTAGRRCSPARPRHSPSCSRRWGEVRWSRTTGRRCGATPATARPPSRDVRLSNDTMVAAYLIDPARRRYPAGRAARPGRHRAGRRGRRRGRAGGGRGARAVRRRAGGDRPPRAALRCWRRSSCRWWTSSTGWSCRA